jgi:hypothetical protein
MARGAIDRRYRARYEGPDLRWHSRTFDRKINAASSPGGQGGGRGDLRPPLALITQDVSDADGASAGFRRRDARPPPRKRERRCRTAGVHRSSRRAPALLERSYRDMGPGTHSGRRGPRRYHATPPAPHLCIIDASRRCGRLMKSERLTVYGSYPAPGERLELSTHGLTVRCSAELSYPGMHLRSDRRAAWRISQGAWYD